jgi:hypothetical protein
MYAHDVLTQSCHVSVEREHPSNQALELALPNTRFRLHTGGRGFQVRLAECTSLLPLSASPTYHQ